MVKVASVILEKSDMSVKILFTGAQGTGKTSVMETLPDLLPKLKGITRTCIKEKNLTINKESNDVSQCAIFDAYERQLIADNSFISERSLIDVVAFTEYQCLHKKCSAKVFHEQVKKLVLFIKENPTAVHVYFPIEFDPVEDGTRSTDKDYQRAIDDLIFATLIDCGANFITVHGTIEERVEQVTNLIKSCLTD